MAEERDQTQRRIDQLLQNTSLYGWTSQTESDLISVADVSTKRVRDAVESYLFEKLDAGELDKSGLLLSLIIFRRHGKDSFWLSEFSHKYLSGSIYSKDLAILQKYMFDNEIPLPGQLVYDITERILLNIESMYSSIVRQFQSVPISSAEDTVLYLTLQNCRVDLNTENKEMICLIISHMEHVKIPEVVLTQAEDYLESTFYKMLRRIGKTEPEERQTVRFSVEAQTARTEPSEVAKQRLQPEPALDLSRREDDEDGAEETAARSPVINTEERQNRDEEAAGMPEVEEDNHATPLDRVADEGPEPDQAARTGTSIGDSAGKDETAGVPEAEGEATVDGTSVGGTTAERAVIPNYGAEEESDRRDVAEEAAQEEVNLNASEGGTGPHERTTIDEFSEAPDQAGSAHGQSSASEAPGESARRAEDEAHRAAERTPTDSYVGSGGAAKDTPQAAAAGSARLRFGREKRGEEEGIKLRGLDAVLARIKERGRRRTDSAQTTPEGGPNGAIAADEPATGSREAESGTDTKGRSFFRRNSLLWVSVVAVISIVVFFFIVL